MHALVITFDTAGLSREDMDGLTKQFAPTIAEVSGLVSKTFIAGIGDNVYGGLYQFRNKAAADAYLASDIITGFKADPHVSNFTVTEFEILEEQSRICRGIPSVLAS